MRYLAAKVRYLWPGGKTRLPIFLNSHNFFYYMIFLKTFEIKQNR